MDPTSPVAPGDSYALHASEAGDLETNAIWQAMKHQVETLRSEMKDSRKSVEDAENNSLLSNPKTSDASGVGFGR